MWYAIKGISLGVMVTLLGACSDFNAKQTGYSVLHQSACQRTQEHAIHPATESCSNHNYARDYATYQRERAEMISSE